VSAIEHPPLLRLPGIPDHVTYTWLVMIILAVVAFAASRRLSLVPRGVQNFMEVVLEQFLGLVRDLIGPEGHRYLPLVATLGIFILTANLIGLVPGFVSPTASLNTTAACAIIVFFTYHWVGLRKQGPVRYFRHFMGPVIWLAPLMVPIEFITQIIVRPITLSVRLWANFLAGHFLLAVFFLGTIALLQGGILAIVGPFAFAIAIALVGFEIFVSILQAFIFAILTASYIGGAMAEEH